MTEQPAAYPGYATPTFTHNFHDVLWVVSADPWEQFIGQVYDKGPVGWTAWDLRNHPVGLFPDKQAAGEALVRHAGYEVL